MPIDEGEEGISNVPSLSEAIQQWAERDFQEFTARILRTRTLEILGCADVQGETVNVPFRDPQVGADTPYLICDAARCEPVTVRIEEIATAQIGPAYMEVPTEDSQRFLAELARGAFRAALPGTLMTMEQSDWVEGGRTLSERERLFMLRDAGRIEYELRWLLNNNATVSRCYDECRRAHLSETTAAEYALICLARELEDQRGKIDRPSFPDKGV